MCPAWTFVSPKKWEGVQLVWKLWSHEPAKYGQIMLVLLWKARSYYVTFMGHWTWSFFSSSVNCPLRWIPYSLYCLLVSSTCLHLEFDTASQLSVYHVVWCRLTRDLDIVWTCRQRHPIEAWVALFIAFFWTQNLMHWSLVPSIEILIAQFSRSRCSNVYFKFLPKTNFQNNFKEY